MGLLTAIRVFLHAVLGDRAGLAAKNLALRKSSYSPVEIYSAASATLAAGHKFLYIIKAERVTTHAPMAVFDLVDHHPGHVAQFFTGYLSDDIRDPVDQILGLFLTKFIFKNIDLYKWHSLFLSVLSKKTPSRHADPERGIRQLSRSQGGQVQAP